LAAEPRPWQRISRLRAKRTIEFTVRKYGAYSSFSISRELVEQGAAHLVRQAVGIAQRGALPGQPLERLLRRQSGKSFLLGYW
jgi:hypothetical protein